MNRFYQHYMIVFRKTLPESVLSNYKIVRYSEYLSSTWDDFVESKSINGTFLHSRKFYNHNVNNRLADNSYLFYKKNKLIAVIGCTLNTERVLISHLRSTYGGFVLAKKTGVESSIAIVQLFLEEAKRNNVKEIIIKNPFRIFYKTPADEFDYALWYFGFGILYRELEIAIPLHQQVNIEAGFTEGTRSGLHKAMKALIVEESLEYKTYWGLLAKTLQQRHNVMPTHNYQEFCDLLENLGREKIKLFITKKDNKIIAGLVLFILNDVCVHAQYIAYDIAYQNDRPLNILLYTVSKWAQYRGYLYFNLGRANEDNGNIINFNLFKFKESYGGCAILRETLHLKL